MKSATAGSSCSLRRQEFQPSTVATPPIDNRPVTPLRASETERVRIASRRSSTARLTRPTRRAIVAENAFNVTRPSRLSRR